MRPSSLVSFIGRLRRLVEPSAGRLDDGELLERFATRGDEPSFEVLVWRYGPLVLGVCRRILRREQDVEDAFQATFLTLARKAGSIARREALGGWLHQVAYRIGLRARARAERSGILDLSQSLVAHRAACSGCASNSSIFLARLSGSLSAINERTSAGGKDNAC